MLFLVIGDIVGKPGRQAIHKFLAGLRRQYGVVAMWKRESYDPETRIVTSHQDFEGYGPNSLPMFVREMHLRFRVIEPGEFEKLATSAGFRIADLYGDYSREPFSDDSSPYMIWILTK